MQTDDLENRVSNHTSLLQYLNYPAETSYRHFTMPSRQNGNCGKEVEKGGLLSKRPPSSFFQTLENQVITSSDPSPSTNGVAEKVQQNGHSHQQPMDKVITSPIALPIFKAPAKPRTNGHSHQQPMDKVITSPIALPIFKAPAKPRTNGHSNGQARHEAHPSINLNHASTIGTVPPIPWGGNHHASWLYDQETRRLSVAKVTTKHKTTFSDMLHFLGYTVGATTIVSLYMIVPLMILLNAILPSTWDRLLIALGILAVVEFLICIILAKTTPRSKRKKENVLVQP
jgi:hypothetical protein